MCGGVSQVQGHGDALKLIFRKTTKPQSSSAERWKKKKKGVKSSVKDQGVEKTSPVEPSTTATPANLNLGAVTSHR